MRPFVLAAVLTLSACAASTPQRLCACQPEPPPAPAPEVWPLPLMDDAQFGRHVAGTIDGLCAAPADVGDGWGRRAAAARRGMSASGPDAFVLRMATSELSVETPTAERDSCRIVLTAPTRRVIAVDAALKDWAADQPMTWNVRDSPSDVTPGVNNTRLRGIADRGEARLRWEYTPAADADVPAELRAEWTPGGAD